MKLNDNVVKQAQKIVAQWSKCKRRSFERGELFQPTFYRHQSHR